MISVIVPVYNVEKYLNRCIDSILSQSNVDFELILIDDGSTDKSGEICDSYQSDRRVKIIHKENNGVSSARNDGIDASHGEYLLFVDSDDWLADKAFELLIENSNNADMVVCGAINAKLNDNGEFEYSDRVSWDKNSAFEVEDVYYGIFNVNVTLWNKLIKRSVVEEIRFDEHMSYGEDCDFLCRILPNVKKTVIVPQKLYYYFVNRSGSVVSSGINQKSIELLENTKKIYEYLSQQGRPSSGLRRIYIVLEEVISKIPITKKGIKENKKYIRQARKLLFYPNAKHIISFMFDKKIEKRIRCKYLLKMMIPFYMYLRLLKKYIFHG